MPKIRLYCSPPGASCAMCRVQAMKRNRLVKCLFLPAGATQYKEIDLHVPCMGLFLVFNRKCTLRLWFPR